MLISKILLQFWIPDNYLELLQFLILAFLIGFIVDYLIYKFQIFGDSLNDYYNLTTPGVWGGIAFIFSIIVSYFIMKFFEYII
jgi:hypothetical protein